jgi:hypothetical protein
LVASVVSYGSLSLMSGVMARGVSPSADAPMLPDRQPRRPPQPIVSNVAFAPAAMSALIEAQERLPEGAPQLVRVRTMAEIDRLIAILGDRPADAVAAGGAPLSVRELQGARQALALSPIDIQA